MPTDQIYITRVRKKLHSWYHPEKIKYVKTNAIFKIVTDLHDKLSAIIRITEILYLSPNDNTSSDDHGDDESDSDDADKSTSSSPEDDYSNSDNTSASDEKGK